MQLSETKLREWLNECYRIDSVTHMLLVVDRTENFETYPVKVHSHQNIKTIESFYKSRPDSQVVEIYNMALPLEEQMESKIPVFNYNSVG